MMAELHPPELHGVGPIEAENIRLQYQSVALSFLVVIFIPKFSYLFFNQLWLRPFLWLCIAPEALHHR